LYILNGPFLSPLLLCPVGEVALSQAQCRLSERWRNPPAQLQARPNQEPESKPESDRARAPEPGESKSGSDLLWTPKSESKEGSDWLFTPEPESAALGRRGGMKRKGGTQRVDELSMAGWFLKQPHIRAQKTQLQMQIERNGHCCRCRSREMGII
jgi:hypothetical protein